VRAGQESAEAIVAKKAGESRQERRAEEPRDQPTNSGKERSEKSSETVLDRQPTKGHFQDWSGGEKGVELPREPTDGRRARRQANQVHEGSPKVQPPDAENRTSGGVGGSRCAITVTRPDS
jgi:hypothetical protein